MVFIMGDGRIHKNRTEVWVKEANGNSAEVFLILLATYFILFLSS